MELGQVLWWAFSVISCLAGLVKIYETIEKSDWVRKRFLDGKTVASGQPDCEHPNNTNTGVSRWQKYFAWVRKNLGIITVVSALISVVWAMILQLNRNQLKASKAPPTLVFVGTNISKAIFNPYYDRVFEQAAKESLNEQADKVRLNQPGRPFIRAGKEAFSAGAYAYAKVMFKAAMTNDIGGSYFVPTRVHYHATLLAENPTHKSWLSFCMDMKRMLFEIESAIKNHASTATASGSHEIFYNKKSYLVSITNDLNAITEHFQGYPEKQEFIQQTKVAIEKLIDKADYP